MLKNILKLNGVQELKNENLKKINGGAITHTDETGASCHSHNFVPCTLISQGDRRNLCKSTCDSLGGFYFNWVR